MISLTFSFIGLAQVLALRADRAGCADDRLGRHGGDLPCQGDHRPGAGGHRAARRDIDRHRHVAGADDLHDLGHRVDAAAGRVELQDQHLGALLFGGFDPALEVQRQRRGDGAVKGQHQRQGRGALGLRPGQDAGRLKEAEKTNLSG